MTSQWLRSMLIDKGVLSEAGLSRNAGIRTCRTCRTSCLAGIAITGLERATLAIARYVHKHPEGVTRKQAKDAAGRWKPVSSEAINVAIERGYITATPIEYNGVQGHEYHPGAITP